MFDKVLVALDGSEHAARALDMAAGLSRRCDATLVLFHAVEVSAFRSDYDIRVIESARGRPASSGRSSGQAWKNAPYAPSMWCQSPSRAATSATASNGSTAPVFVVPALVTTMNGRSPRERSSAMAAGSALGSSRKRASTGSARTRSGMTPASRADLATEW